MPRRKRKSTTREALDTIVAFTETVDMVFERLTGKPIAAWMEEFRQRPRELPAGEQMISSEPKMPLADAYAILGLKPDASIEDVKKHYRNLAKVFHTDVGGMNDEAMKLINRAYETITKGKV